MEDENNRHVSSMKPLAGGDFYADVDEIEIDTNAAMIYDLDRGNVIIMKAGSVKSENEEYVRLNLGMGLQTKKKILLPFWCRHHWLLLVIDNNTATVYDSAPSDMVMKDVKKWCKERGVIVNEGRGICPQQQRHSRECGIFTISFVGGLSENI